MHLENLLMCEATKSLHLCLQSIEGSGQTSSIAEGTNEGEEGEADGLSADTESLAPSSRRVTEDSVISEMLGMQIMQPRNAQTTHSWQGRSCAAMHNHDTLLDHGCDG